MNIIKLKKQIIWQNKQQTTNNQYKDYTRPLTLEEAYFFKLCITNKINRSKEIEGFTVQKQLPENPSCFQVVEHNQCEHKPLFFDLKNKVINIDVNSIYKYQSSIIFIKPTDWNLLMSNHQNQLSEEEESYKEKFYGVLDAIASLQHMYRQKMANIEQNVSIDKGLEAANERLVKYYDEYFKDKRNNKNEK